MTHTIDADGLPAAPDRFQHSLYYFGQGTSLLLRSSELTLNRTAASAKSRNTAKSFQIVGLAETWQEKNLGDSCSFGIKITQHRVGILR